MTLDKIKLLLESYYSGDISPEDYEMLLSSMKEIDNLPPELENERRMLLAVDSYEPVMPDDLEKRLSESIDKRYRKTNNILRVLLPRAAAAATVFICVTLAILNLGDKDMPNSEDIANSTMGYKEETRTTFSTVGTNEGSGIKSESAESTVASEVKEESVNPEIDDKELEKAMQLVDESLLNVLSMIYIAQNNVAESFENIHTDHKILNN